MNNMTEREQVIYDRLCDEESQRIFKDCKQFALNNDETGFANDFSNRKELAEIVEKIRGKTYVIYGAAFAGEMLMRYFNLIGLSSSCIGIWDRDPNKQGVILCNCTIMPPKYEQINEVDVFLISSIRSETTESIMEILASYGVSEEKIVKTKAFGTTLGSCGVDIDTQYFDKDIIIPRFNEDEVFVDAGCCDFSTSASLLKLNPNVKRIYAFEPDHENMQSVLRRVENCVAQDITKRYDVALWSSNTELGFYINNFNKGGSRIYETATSTKIQCRKLDDIILPTDKVSFIKMDIEGSELEALKGASEIIKRDKPKLAISAYHKTTDYVDLAEYILSIVPSYKLYMRLYTPLHWETVLYCVI